VATTSVREKAERRRRARALAYGEALQRLAHELLDDGERQELLDRIRRYERQILREGAHA
jgi:hypothetical protein